MLPSKGKILAGLETTRAEKKADRWPQSPALLSLAYSTAAGSAPGSLKHAHFPFLYNSVLLPLVFWVLPGAHKACEINFCCLTWRLYLRSNSRMGQGGWRHKCYINIQWGDGYQRLLITQDLCFNCLIISACRQLGPRLTALSRNQMVWSESKAFFNGVRLGGFYSCSLCPHPCWILIKMMRETPSHSLQQDWWKVRRMVVWEPWIMSVFAVYYFVFLKPLAWFHFAEIRVVSVSFWAHPDCSEWPRDGVGADTLKQSPQRITHSCETSVPIVSLHLKVFFHVLFT